MTKSGGVAVEAQSPPTAHPQAWEKLHRTGSQRWWGIDWPPGRNPEKPWSLAEEAPRWLAGEVVAGGKEGGPSHLCARRERSLWSKGQDGSCPQQNQPERRPLANGWRTVFLWTVGQWTARLSLGDSLDTSNCVHQACRLLCVLLDYIQSVIFFFFFCPHHIACAMLGSEPGTKAAVERWCGSPLDRHWIAIGLPLDRQGGPPRCYGNLATHFRAFLGTDPPYHLLLNIKL